MSRLELIEHKFGKDVADYVQRKNKGGTSGKKGSRYEDFFQAYKVAELAVGRQASDAWPKIGSQELSLVDDTVIAEVASTKYHQLKNAKSVSWTNGDHPIKDDFRMQHELSVAENEPDPRTILVVSDETLRLELEQSIPAQIAAFASVQRFPHAATLNRLILENHELHDVLAKLSRSVHPNYDELEGVLGVLLMGCMNLGDRTAVDTILTDVRRMIPNMLCAWHINDPTLYVRVDFQEVLDAIPNLTYSFAKGFFRWDAYGTSGIFNEDCSTESFKEFQERVIRAKPTTFDDLEGLLP